MHGFFIFLYGGPMFLIQININKNHGAPSNVNSENQLSADSIGKKVFK